MFDVLRKQSIAISCSKYVFVFFVALPSKATLPWLFACFDSLWLFCRFRLTAHASDLNNTRWIITYLKKKIRVMGMINGKEISKLVVMNESRVIYPKSEVVMHPGINRRDEICFNRSHSQNDAAIRCCDAKSHSSLLRFLPWFESRQMPWLLGSHSRDFLPRRDFSCRDAKNRGCVNGTSVNEKCKGNDRVLSYR